MVKQKPLQLIQAMRARLLGVLFIVGCLVATVSAFAAPTTPAYAQPPFGNTPGLTSGYGQNVSSCEIETVGWVICPVMRSIAKLADFGFAFINENFLKIEFGITNTSSGVYKAWELMRTVANALFVLAFMAIVYAQITGKSAGGYNIKRLLPKLIIGAILVNISYFICAAAIEVSNAIGGSILAIMQGISDQIGPAAMTLSSAENGFEDSRLSDITSAILTKSGTVWILLAPVAAVTVSVAVICAAGLVLLIMRKVVVAMLVLVSPIIFVTYLLPNTERYYQQWLRLFFQLLLLYPVIAFLLGTGQIISATIINVGSESDSNYRVRDDSYNARNGGSGSATTDLAAAGAAVLPLLGTWFLLKAASSFATNTGSKVAGTIGRRGKNQEQKIKAQMDSKAKQSVNSANGGLPTYDRKPAFSRLRTRRRGASSLADGLATKGSGNGAKPGSAVGGSSGSGIPGAAAGAGGDTNGSSLFDRAIGNVNGSVEAEAAKKAQEATETKLAEAEANQAKDAQNIIAAAASDDKKKTAKDIFNNMNKTHQMDGKNSGGGGNGGGNGGGGGSNGGQAGSVAQPKAPSNNYSASNVASQAQNQSAPAAEPKIIAVPVQAVDASTFLNKTPGDGGGMIHPPTTEIESKAKERANKYLFDSQNDVDKSSDRLDEIKEIRDEQRKADERNKAKDDK